MDLGGIDYLGLDRVLRRGTGELIASRDRAVLVHDSVSGAWLLACEDRKQGAELLARHFPPEGSLLMVSDLSLGRAVFEDCGFSDMLECYQAAYYGKMPEAEPGLSLRPAGSGDLPLLTASYDLVSPEELAQIVERQRLLLGYDGERLVGFVGEHLEGSMGLLYVFPPFRRRGYAAALERQMIARTMAEGFIPFGQVEKDNLASLALQMKLGMTLSDNLICWMWR